MIRRAFRLALLLIAGQIVLSGARSDAEETKIGVRFLDAKEAAVAIVDESMEPYFSLLQPLEMIAKTNAPMEATELAKQRDECRLRYQAAVREFTDDEKAAIAGAAEEIHDALKETYPVFAETPWSFVKLDMSIEGGMPFTHGPHIVIPERLAKKFAEVKAKGVDPAKSHLGEVLIHEQCHVLQRAHPSLFADLYVNVWGFIRAKDISNCPWLERQQIVNPDGPDVGWVFPAKDGKTVTYYQPLVTLADGIARPRMPNDFVLVGVVLDRKGATFAPHLGRGGKEGRPDTLPLDQIPAYVAAFGRVSENFHPNETFAVLFSWLAMKEHVADAGPGLETHASVDFSKVREWCLKKFAGTPPQGK